VYVKAIDTLYAETACGSGTAAIALAVSAQRNNSSATIQIDQPSGHPLHARTSYSNNNFKSVFIAGEVSILYEGAF